jgi:CO/xanthine dehydrogenase Mo-binding subunit
MKPEDLPQPIPRFGPQYQDRPVMADGETKYHGEVVAAVVAETKDAAEEGALLVKVEYQVLPALSTLEAALAAGAELVQDPAVRRPGPLVDTNVLSEYHFGWGDVDAVARDADFIVENTYDWASQTQFAIEPPGFMAAPDGDGIVVWSSIQHPYQLQKTLAKVLRLPMSKVRVYAPDPGGAFGGKQHPKLEPLVAFMALRAERPVRLILTLEEAFQAVRSAGARMTVRTGIKKDGTLVFQDFANDFLVGAYGDTGDRISAKASFLSAGPYRTPAVRIITGGALTPPATRCRCPQVTWARINLDRRRSLGIDRWRSAEPRQKYGERPGDTGGGDWPQTVRGPPRSGGAPAQGQGIAIGLKSAQPRISYSTCASSPTAVGPRHLRHGSGAPDLCPDRR